VKNCIIYIKDVSEGMGIKWFYSRSGKDTILCGQQDWKTSLERLRSILGENGKKDKGIKRIKALCF